MLQVREANRFYKSLLHITLKNGNLHLRFSKICRHYSSKPTHYEVLGLTREASGEDIRAAYIKKSKECHPDTNSKDPANHGQFISVNEAYTVLSKPLSRISYDAILQKEQTQKQSASHFTPPHYQYSDAELQRVRNIRYQDQMRKTGTNTGTGGSNRVTNIKTVAGCLLLIVAGSFLHYLAFTWSTEIHLKNMDARDAMARRQLLAAKEQVNLLWQKQTEDRARSFHVQENSIPRDG